MVPGIGISHMPMLTLPGAQWKHRAEVGYNNPALCTTDARTLDYTQLLAEVGPEYDQQISDEALACKAHICQAALDHLADALERAAPDVVVIGVDQSEHGYRDAGVRGAASGEARVADIHGVVLKRIGERKICVEEDAGVPASWKEEQDGCHSA